MYTHIRVRLANRPPQNAFSDRLQRFGFDIHSALLPDIMHESELGGWKALFVQLLRMLESLDEENLIELDRRCAGGHPIFFCFLH